MKECNCKEPCEDCKHEENVNLDDISGVLFNDLNNNLGDKSQENKEVETEVKVEELNSKKENKEKPKVVKKENPRKIECENIKYKDPIKEEYKLEQNNKMGFNLWDTEIRTFNF